MGKKKVYPPEGFPERLDQAIYDRGMTKCGVAGEIGLERKAIWHYTKGEISPNITTLMKLCKLLNVSADYLIFGKEVMPGE